MTINVIWPKILPTFPQDGINHKRRQGKKKTPLSLGAFPLLKLPLDNKISSANHRSSRRPFQRPPAYGWRWTGPARPILSVVPGARAASGTLGRLVQAESSKPGLVVVDAALNLVASNTEAIQILVFPTRPDKVRQVDSVVSERIRTRLLDKHAAGGPGFAYSPRSMPG